MSKQIVLTIDINENASYHNHGSGHDSAELLRWSLAVAYYIAWGK